MTCWLNDNQPINDNRKKNDDNNNNNNNDHDRVGKSYSGDYNLSGLTRSIIVIIVWETDSSREIYYLKLIWWKWT